MRVEQHPASQAIQVTQLRALLAVAEIGSLTKAADLLGYSEPAVHQQLSALRRVLGDPLLARVHGRMQLTSFGEALLPDVQAALAAVDALVQHARQLQTTPSAHLAIGVGRSTGAHVMPIVGSLFHEAFPWVETTIIMQPYATIMTGLVSGDLDLGFSGGLEAAREALPAKKNVAAVRWSRYAWVFMCSPDYLAATTGRTSAPIPIYIPSFFGPIDTLVANFCAAGIDARFIQIDNAEAGKAVAVAQLGVACLPMYAARLELTVGELVPCLEELPLHQTWIDVAHVRGASNSAVGTFVHFLREVRTRAVVRRLLSLPQSLALR